MAQFLLTHPALRHPPGLDLANRLTVEAADPLTEESWSPEEHPLPLTVRATLAPLASERAAREDASARGEIEARQATSPSSISAAARSRSLRACTKACSAARCA
jgi:hypothetical protein